MKNRAASNLVKPKFPLVSKEKKAYLNSHIMCLKEEFNPNNKENPFELSDETAYYE